MDDHDYLNYKPMEGEYLGGKIIHMPCGTPGEHIGFQKFSDLALFYCPHCRKQFEAEV